MSEVLLKVNKAVCAVCGNMFAVGEMVQAEMVGELKEFDDGSSGGIIAILQTKLLCQVCILDREKEEEDKEEKRG